MAKSLATATLMGLATLFTLCSAQTPHFNWTETKHLIAFGDSYTFIQGTAGRTNKTFIGSYLPGEFAFSSSKLLNNKIVQNFSSTAEGGTNWVEYLTGCAVKDGTYSPASCSIQLWDFAYSGASVSAQFLAPHSTNTVPLVNQTQQYLTYADPVLVKAPVSLNKTKALVAIWIGINDVFDSQTGKPAGTSDQDFWGAELDAVFSQSAQSLLKAGYKNFLFLNLPPLDRTRANQRTTTPYPTTAQVNLWGSLLQQKAAAFQSANAGVKTMLYDANTFLNNVFNNPTKYAIKNTSTYCPAYNQADVLSNPSKYGCYPLSQYFWYNGVHMASHTHQLLATDLTAFLNSQTT